MIGFSVSLAASYISEFPPIFVVADSGGGRGFCLSLENHIEVPWGTEQARESMAYVLIWR